MDTASLKIDTRDTALAGQTPADVLERVFGYSAFRGHQAEIIDHVIAGGSCCVLMPTGSGKSLCYQIPALCMRGVGIVVSPLIALMDDQVSALRELGVRAGAIHSGMDRAAVQDVYERLRDEALDLLYVAPERLMTDDFLNMLNHVNVALFAIDEAHCISQWGHDFRPEYRQLFALREMFPGVPCIAVTATADTPTRADIMEKLGLPRIFTAGFDRPNIHYTVGTKNGGPKQLLEFLRARSSEDSGIVYCLSRRKVEETAQFLRDNGYNAWPYHAGMDPGTRAKNQSRFLKEESVIIVATIAFGMGINKPDVRFVAHLDMPKNIEAYYQETGRAGRDGLPSVAWMVYGMQDVVLQRQMIEGSDMPEEQKRVVRHKLNALLGYCETIRCRRQILLEYFDDSIAPCGNCDICLSPPKTIDGTVAAQKVISCVYRTGERFGAQYVIDVLMGKDDERIRKFGHDSVSTFGIGTEYDRTAWQGIVRQLVTQNFLYVNMNSHSELKITDQGAQFLRDKTPIALRLEEKPARAKTRLAAKAAVADAALATDGDRDLLAVLKTLRMAVAREQNLPPYVVFHDKTLIDMVVIKPVNMDQLAMVHGVGQSKLEKYGAVFLKAIKERM
ncbi:MAG: DNA helicase RecQ [Alphaproteobacteria bacterium]|nr:DNA helicase RecQ [Alphaproteobacteria bacterium]